MAMQESRTNIKNENQGQGGMFLLRMKKKFVFIFHEKKRKRRELIEQLPGKGKTQDHRWRVLLNQTRFKVWTTAPKDQDPTLMGLLSGIGFIYPQKLYGLVFLVLRTHK